MKCVVQIFESINQMSTEHLVHNGKYYGYPECCIQEFIKYYLKEKPRTDEQEKVHQFSGFIPCHQHALEILAGKITLQAIILPSRKHPKPILRTTK